MTHLSTAPPPPSPQVPVSLYQWQLAAFGGVMVINVLNILFCTSQVQYNCNVLLIAIHSVAFFTDLALVRRATPLVRGGVLFGAYGPAAPMAAARGLFFPLRYVQWLHSTPTMLLLMALMSDLSSAQLGATIASDVAMIVTGLLASWLGGPMQGERRGRRRGGRWGQQQQEAWLVTQPKQQPMQQQVLDATS